MSKIIEGNWLNPAKISPNDLAFESIELDTQNIFFREYENIMEMLRVNDLGLRDLSFTKDELYEYIKMKVSELYRNKFKGVYSES